MSTGRPKQPAVYILTNATHTVLYTGVTSDLIRRVWQHKQKLVPGFASRYRADKLVWYELGENMLACIEREKQIKGGSRAKKIALVASVNATWRDLYPEIASSAL